MARKFWTILVASLFIICMASAADAQRRAKPQRGLHAGQGQGENPGNGNQGENPGNGNQGESPQDPPTRTPDGSTPAEEVTCDNLKHGTPGLYGLCIAFCEAHDCEVTVTDDGELDFSGCKKSDGKILAKYRKKMRDGDPDMPCLPAAQANEDPENSCPCWSLEQLANFPYAAFATDIAETEVYCDNVPEYDWAQGVDFYFDLVSESTTLGDGTLLYVDFAANGAEGYDGNFCFGAFDCIADDPAKCPDWLPVHDWAVGDLDDETYLNCQAQILELQAVNGCGP